MSSRAAHGWRRKPWCTERAVVRIASTYDFAHIAEAMRHLDDGHARAKVVVTI